MTIYDGTIQPLGSLNELAKRPDAYVSAANIAISIVKRASSPSDFIPAYKTLISTCCSDFGITDTEKFKEGLPVFWQNIQEITGKLFNPLEALVVEHDIEMPYFLLQVFITWGIDKSDFATVDDLTNIRATLYD
ncbi:hypothetical protein GOV04_00305 [Candidatus Woesearchaeota archaeon]|nr:hypothetical protein [Candidatus Woesearchaeota archaeon]